MGLLTRSTAIALAVFLPVAAHAAAPEALADAASSVQRAPLAAFAQLPLLAGVTLSPNGERIAALLNEPERTLLITRAVNGGAAAAVLMTDNKEFQFKWARWVNDERLLVSVRFASRRGFVGTVETRLLSVKADGSGLRVLQQSRPVAGSMTGVVRTQQFQDQVVDWLPDDGQHVLIQAGDGDSSQPSVDSVDINTGQRRTVQAPRRKTIDWLTDAQHRVRIGLQRDDDEGYEVRARDPDGKEWRTLWRFGAGEPGTWPLGFGLDPQLLYVIAEHQGRRALFSVRLDDPALPRTLLLSHERVDIDGSLLRSPLTGEVLGLRSAGIDGGANGDETRTDVWNPAWRQLAKSIDAVLPEQNNRLLDISKDEQRYLVYTSGNGKPGRYFIGDRRTGELLLLGDTHPALEGTALRGKRALTIMARDGLALRGYLTEPAGRRAGQPVSLVLFPHGGPASRDDADFDAWSEFFASRGHAVLQLNFRGSDGYGSALRSAGLQRWGLEMQDDLSDAVKWAVAQGIADPKRICIVGASYGGYAALMGLAKTPELYRCAVSFAGVSNLPDLIAYESDYVGGAAAMKRQLGDGWRDRERLRQTSPELLAERFQAPVLLVHGTADRVVPVEQSEGMAKALRSAKKPVRFIEQEGGDHHLGDNRHRLELFQAMERFLDENLAP